MDRVEVDTDGEDGLADAAVTQGVDGDFGRFPVTSYDFGNGDFLQIRSAALTDTDVDFISGVLRRTAGSSTERCVNSTSIEARHF